MAKGYNVPIIHVNADDPEACVSSIRLAMAYRQRWGRDVVIDLIGYRRYGHNETDEPAYTQPLMATAIKQHPPVSEIYAEELVADGVVSPEDVEAKKEERAGLPQAGARGAAREDRVRRLRGPDREPAPASSTAPAARTSRPPSPTSSCASSTRSCCGCPTASRSTASCASRSRSGARRSTEGGIEFGHAESLAFASLLTEGVHVRLTGQDTERGTFSHRHLVLHDEKTGLRYAPIQNLKDAKAPMELHNSPLSETACLGFEYGYSAASPDSLVLWEAQFGDFGNAAQVIIDSFIVSAEAKWGQMTRLTLLLPHGYEGAGPEHSSARIERFVQLAAEGNIRIANPTTAAQYFHLLRRQAHIAKARPLVVFTPKGLLRLPRGDLEPGGAAGGAFQFVLDDPGARTARRRSTAWSSAAARSTTTSRRHRSERTLKSVAIARVELLYPFAKAELTKLIESYPNLKEIVWVQEEPRNMGAWSVMQRRMPELLPEGVELGYVGRPPRASPGEGYAVAHSREQERIVLTRPGGQGRPGLAFELRPVQTRACRRHGCLPCPRRPTPGPLFQLVKIVSWLELGLFAALLFFWLAPGFEGADLGLRPRPRPRLPLPLRA